MAVDGQEVHAEDMDSGEILICLLREIPAKIGFFFPMIGMSKKHPILRNVLDVRAANRLNKLYLEIAKVNPGYSRKSLDHFFAQSVCIK